MNTINNLAEKIRTFFLSNVGKIMSSVFGISLILTFIIAATQNNSIAISFIKSITSALIVCIIIYALAIILKKSLKDIIPSDIFDKNKDKTDKEEEMYDIIDDDQKDKINSEKNELNNDENNDNVYKSKDNTYEKENDENKSHTDSNNKNDNIDMDIPDSNILDNISDVDKNSKVDYHNTNNDDISSIIFGSNKGQSSSSNSVSSSDSSGGFTMFDDAHPAKSQTSKGITMDDPQMLAKAVRTMRSRDNEKTKDKS